MAAIDILRRLAAAGGVDPAGLDESGFHMSDFGCCLAEGRIHLTVYSRGRLPRARVFLGEEGQIAPPRSTRRIYWNAVESGVYQPVYHTRNGWLYIDARKRDIRRAKMWLEIAQGAEPSVAARRHDLGETLSQARTEIDEPGDITPEEALRRLILGGLSVETIQGLDQAEIIRYLYGIGAVGSVKLCQIIVEHGLPYEGCWANAVKAIADAAWE